MSRKRLAGLFAITVVTLIAVVLPLRAFSVAKGLNDASGADTPNVGTAPHGVAKGQQRIIVADRPVIDPVDQPSLPTANLVRTVSRYLPIVDQPDIRPRQKDIADEALRTMDAACVDAIKNFYVVYTDQSSRGQAGKSTIILLGTVDAAETDASADEFRALVLHEFAHVTSLSGCLDARDVPGESAFHDGASPIAASQRAVEFYEISWVDDHTQRIGSTDADFVSGYAASEPIEDFAETFAYYLTQPEAMRVRAQENASIARKLAWMEQNVFKGGLILAQGEAGWSGVVPWDATRLPYRWLGQATEKPAQTALGLSVGE